MRLDLFLIVLAGGYQDLASVPAIPSDPLAEEVASSTRAQFVQGLEEAEAFRQWLLVVDAGGTSRANRLGRAIDRFRRSAQELLAGRPGVGAFAIDPDVFEARIRGVSPAMIDAERVFGPFAGRWYGLWDRSPVDHDWSAVVCHPAPVLTSGCGGLLVRATQSAWVGDGFGWNVVASPAEDAAVILGTVSHVEPGHPDRVRLRRPHVGIDAGAGRLIWLTRSEVFLEEILPGENPAGTRYAITGFRYELHDGSVAFVSPGFQAIYTRDPNDRPSWYTFSIGNDPDESSVRTNAGAP